MFVHIGEESYKLVHVVKHVFTATHFVNVVYGCPMEDLCSPPRDKVTATSGVSFSFQLQIEIYRRLEVSSFGHRSQFCPIKMVL